MECFLRVDVTFDQVGLMKNGGKLGEAFIVFSCNNKLPFHGSMKHDMSSHCTEVYNGTAAMGRDCPGPRYREILSYLP